VELSQIKYFIAAAQTQNLSKASQMLNITQSALSKSIANLEAELGVLLFDRSGKKITLNESGKKFLEYAINSVRELDNAVSAALHQDIRAVLYLGLFHYSEKFMQCLKAFSELHANIIIQLDHLEITSFDAAANEYDMLLFPQIPMFRKYKSIAIYSDSYFLAVHKSNPLANSTHIKLSDLSAQKLIFIKFKDNLFDLPYYLYTNMFAIKNERIFTNSYEMQRWLISINHCVGFVPQDSAKSYALDPNISLLPVLDNELKREMMVGFKRSKHLSDIGKQFAEFVRNYFDI